MPGDMSQLPTHLRALGRSSAMDSPSSAALGSRLASESSAPGGNWLLPPAPPPAAGPCTLRSSSPCAAPLVLLFA